MPFEPIDLTKGGTINYSLRRLARTETPFLSIIHVAFSGTYRPGSAGAPDAGYMMGIMKMVQIIWRPSGTILDLIDLSYVWGDEMGQVLEPPHNHPFAVVIGPKCEPAISSLHHGINTTESILDDGGFYDSFEFALKYMRQAVVDDWNAKRSRVSGSPGQNYIIDSFGVE